MENLGKKQEEDIYIYVKQLNIVLCFCKKYNNVIMC